MAAFPEHIRQVLIQMIPASDNHEITCIVFYDKHPMDNKNIDIVVCTRMCEVKEFYNRDLVSSIKLEGISKPSEIRILRNSKNELFYLVFAKDVITILSRKDKPQIYRVIEDVERYEYIDKSCIGQAYVVVFRKGDAVPLQLDDDLAIIESPEIHIIASGDKVIGFPIVANLKRKLTEAKYNLKCVEETHIQYQNFRQVVAYDMYKKMHPNFDISMFTDGPKELANVVKINVETPWIRVCNEKILIVYNVNNKNQEKLEDVHILLQGTTGQSIEHTTKLFEKVDTSPFWRESREQTLNIDVEMAIAVVMDLGELKRNVSRRVTFCGVIFYKKARQDFCLPIENITLDAVATIEEHSDAFANDLTDPNIILAVLATAKKTDLLLRHIKRPGDGIITLDTFCKYLKMEKVPYCENVAIHKRTPYMTLYGVMLVINQGIYNDDYMLSLSVYSRSQSQVLSLILYIQDAVPFNVVITAPNYKMRAKYSDLSVYSEEILGNTQLLYDYQNYGSSILNRTDYVLKYLDNCIVKMHNSRDPNIQARIGHEIDIFADGEESYFDFKEKMRKESAVGVSNLEGVKSNSPRAYEYMSID